MFEKLLQETFNRVFNDKIEERWKKPRKNKLPTVEVKGRKYHYEQCSESSPYSFVLHGRNGARYGLIGENGVFIALNSKTKKVVEKIGKFKVTENELQWIDPSYKSSPIEPQKELQTDTEDKPLREGKEGKNVHLEHLEDRVIDLGSKGAEQSIDFINTLGASLSGTAQKPYNITVKWDGSPAIFAGKDPQTGKFFVGTKSVFNKNPKINFTHDDIDQNHDGGLAKKLHIALEHLSKLGIEEVLQGDMMYERDDLKRENIGGEEVITFQPNTIVYAVPTDTKLASKIANSKIGVVFHTTYEGGPTLQDMNAKFGADISNLNDTPDVWVDDATYEDVSGTATLTEDETINLKELINKSSRLNKQYSEAFNHISERKDITSLLKIFNNAVVREGKTVENPLEHIKSFIEYVKTRGQKALDKLQPSTQRGIESKKAKENALVETINYIKSNIKPLSKMIEMMTYLTQAKNIIIKKLQQGKQLTKNFIRTDNGYKATSPEGFVAIDHNGNAVKLVDRLEFSTQNFNAAKNWSKPGEEQVAKESEFFEEETDVPERSTDGLTPVIFIVGRYQGFQKGHDSLVQEAKKYLNKVGAKKVAIGVVAGKGTTGDVKNPMTGKERIQFLKALYNNDPQVVIVPEPFDAGHITNVIDPLAKHGMYMKAIFGGSDRTGYVSDIEKLNDKEIWQRDASGDLGFLPVDTKEDGSIDITPIIVNRDDSGKSSVGGNIEGFEKPESLAATRRTKKGKFYNDNPKELEKVEKAQNELYNKIISNSKPVLPKEVMSGSLGRNLIKYWNIPFDAWYKELVPPMYNSPQAKKAYKQLYDKLVAAIGSSGEVSENNNQFLVKKVKETLRNNLGIKEQDENVDPEDIKSLEREAGGLVDKIKKISQTESEKNNYIKLNKKFEEIQKSKDPNEKAKHFGELIGEVQRLVKKAEGSPEDFPSFTPFFKERGFQKVVNKFVNNPLIKFFNENPAGKFAKVIGAGMALGIGAAIASKYPAFAAVAGGIGYALKVFLLDKNYESVDELNKDAAKIRSETRKTFKNYTDAIEQYNNKSESKEKLTLDTLYKISKNQKMLNDISNISKEDPQKVKKGALATLLKARNDIYEGMNKVALLLIKFKRKVKPQDMIKITGIDKSMLNRWYDEYLVSRKSSSEEAQKILSNFKKE